MRYLGRQLAAMEGGEAAYCCASGMAAISSTLLALCESGDHIVASDAVYGGTFALLKVGGWQEGRMALSREGCEQAPTAAAWVSAWSTPRPPPPPPPANLLCPLDTHLCEQDFLPRKAGITTTFVPIADLAAVEAAITPKCVGECVWRAAWG